MAKNKGQRGANPPKPESDSKPAKRAYEGSGHESASERSSPDAARREGQRRDAREEEPEQASEVERKGRRR